MPATRGTLSLRHLAKAFPPVVLLAVLAGCAQAPKEAAQKAAPLVQGGLEALAKPENQRVLDDLARTPAAQHLGEGMGRGLGHGMTESLVDILGAGLSAETAASAMSGSGNAVGLVQTDPAAGQSTRPTTGPAAALAGIKPQAVFGAVATGIDRDIRPAIVSTMRDSVREGMQAALTPETHNRARDMAAAAGGAAVRETARAAREELGPAVATMVREQVGPALGTAVRRELGPALRDVIRDEVAPAVRQVARDGISGAIEGAAGAGTVATADGSPRPASEQAARGLSKGAALGVNDAATEMGLASPALPGRNVQDTLNKAMWIAGCVIAVAGLLALGLIIGMAVLALAVWRSRPQLAGQAAGAHGGTWEDGRRAHAAVATKTSDIDAR